MPALLRAKVSADSEETVEAFMERLGQANKHKQAGNDAVHENRYEDAVVEYGAALALVPEFAVCVCLPLLPLSLATPSFGRVCVSSSLVRFF